MGQEAHSTMMIEAMQGTGQTPKSPEVARKPVPAPGAAAQGHGTIQDTVTISAQGAAKAALGDQDRDGDSR